MKSDRKAVRASGLGWKTRREGRVRKNMVIHERGVNYGLQGRPTLVRVNPVRRANFLYH